MVAATCILSHTESRVPRFRAVFTMWISGGMIRRVLDLSSVIVYNCIWSMAFSNNRLFNLNRTFPNVPQ